MIDIFFTTLEKIFTNRKLIISYQHRYKLRNKYIQHEVSPSKVNWMILLIEKKRGIHLFFSYRRILISFERSTISLSLTLDVLSFDNDR